MRILTAALFVGLACTPALATPTTTTPTAQTSTPAASDAVAKVQKFYLGIDHVASKFRQTVTYSIQGTPKPSDGMVWIAKPGKMRWDYNDDRKKGQIKESFITDGEMAYVVQKQNLQVIKKSVNQNLMPVAVSFLYGKGDLAAEFNADLDTSGKWGTPSDIVLKLTPKQPSAQYTTLFLVVEPAGTAPYHVKQSIIIDAGGNVNQFMFFEPDFTSPVDDKLFHFDPNSVKNQGYRIVDGDAAAGSGAAGSAGVGSGMKM